jgi:hypothetical protein
LSKPKRANLQPTTPAMNDPTLPLPGLSPVSGKSIVANFDGGLLSSNGGVLLLREVEQWLGVVERFAACIRDPRNQGERAAIWRAICVIRLRPGILVGFPTSKNTRS